MNLKEQSALNAPTTDRPEIAQPNMALILAIASGLSVANVYYNQPLLADMGRSFNIPIQQVGFIPTLTQIGYALGLLFLIPLGDRVERRGLIVGVLSLVAWASMAASISPNVTWLAVSSMVLGFTSIGAHLIIPMVAQMTNPAERGKVIGTIISGLIVSLLLARSLSGFVGHLWGWRTMYLIAAGMTIALGFTLLQKLPTNSAASELSYKQLMHSLVHLARQQPVLREAALNNALLFGSFNAFWVTLVFFLESPPYNYDSRVAGLFGLIGVIGAVASPIVGRLADRRGSTVLVGIAVSLALSAFTIFWTAGTHLIALMIGVLVLELGVHTAYLSNQIRVYNLVPKAESRLNTVYMVTNYSGGAIGSFLGTYCWARWQWNGVCALGLCLLSVAAIAHFSAQRKRDRLLFTRSTSNPPSDC